MSFGVYAEQYSQYLRTGGILDMGVAYVILALAQQQLPIFYCVDPYIPGYANPLEFFSPTPYEDRYWMPEFPKEGCHRVILVEEIGRRIADFKVPITLFEVDPTTQSVHKREYMND